MATNEEIRKRPHFDDISLPETGDKKVTILIGSDHPDIIDKQLDKKEGGCGKPSAVKTPFGWTVFGPIEVLHGGYVVCQEQYNIIPMGQNVHSNAKHFYCSCHATWPPCKSFIAEIADERVHVNIIHTERETLNAQLERMYNEEFGDTNGTLEESMSVEDRKAEEIMNQSATLVNGHYHIRLLFREDVPNLPDSLTTAEKRLAWLKRKIQRDPVFHSQYSSVAEKYRTEGSSRQVPDEELAKLDPIWYLTHHAVWHLRKPEEPRVVFDCFSKSGGTSLNEQLMRGPENTSTIMGVILRFRVDDVAVASDIKRMFHQVFVSLEDRGASCYLWWPNGDISREPNTFQMLVHVLGAKSSPSVAGYTLRRTAKDNERDFPPEVVDAVFKDFYVDDLLKSFACEDHAVQISRQLQELLA